MPTEKAEASSANIIGVIPARGGSKGLPRKNIAPVNGKPLIAYTIEAALASSSLGHVFVSTEDAEIAAVAREYGAEVLPRPAELATDDTPSLAVLQHGVTFLETERGMAPELVVLLQPTSPCRTAEDIDGCVRLSRQHGNDPVVSACETEHSPFWSFTIDNERIVPLFPEGQAVTRRQQSPKTYRLNGAVYVWSRDAIMKGNRGPLDENVRPFIMPPERSIDIDSRLDIELAELLLRKRDGTQDR